MAKGHDHDSVRALESHLKAVQMRSEIEACVVTGLQL